MIHEHCVEEYISGANNTRDITYLYDESGIVGAIQTLNSVTETYYFDKNIRGDVIGIFNSSGTKIANYSYDSWGNCTIKTLVSNNFTSYNPIRYRGYYYDRETKLYYLNARYYNPEWRRFISPDETAYLDPENPNGLNLYAYCNNDPVNYADPSGESLIAAALILLAGTVIGGTVGGVVASASAKNNDKELSTKDLLLGIAMGATIGLAAAGLSISATAALYIAAKGSATAIFLFAPANQVLALGLLAYNVFPFILLPLLGMEGEGIEYGDTYNTNQPIIK